MNVNLPENIDLDNVEFQNAWNLIKNTHRSVFLTGKAGTGKSTFLRYICATTKKSYVVLAPTGIAAVNVGGQTLHSFFKIPFKPLLPDDPEFSPRQIRKTLRYSKEKIKLIRKLELIIIDEISMVRADIIDFIDKVLRIYSSNMREPFGGKQLLFVGDVFQLEPVVTRDMREILRRYYNQFFFFNAHVFTSLGLIPIELRKIYRQTDNTFVSMLDRVRVNRASQDDIRQLNSRYDASYTEKEGYIMTLATRRDTVDAINEEHMNALTTPEYTFEGEVEGNFPDNDLPTSKELILKQGAQVIFIRNDKEGRWVNGTIGIVSEVNSQKVHVALEAGDDYELERERWENIQYYYDEKEKKVMETLLGTFTQYPIKPAWALTVHKSQGLTFNRIVIDFAGGAFTSGQTYVALSRCTSLEGITLLKPLSGRDIIVSSSVVNFSRQFNNQMAITGALEQEKAAQLYRRALHALDKNEFGMSLDYFAQAMNIQNMLGSKSARRLLSIKMQRFNRLQKKIDSLEGVIDAQKQMLKNLALEYTEMGNQVLGRGTFAEEPAEAYGSVAATPLDDIAIKSAMANYNKALKIYPACVDAYVGKARLLMVIDEPDRAEATLQEALAIQSECYEAHMCLGELYLNRKDMPAAIKAYKRAVRADKKAVAPLMSLAHLYERIGLDDLAEEYALKARQLRERQMKASRKGRKN
ncbi:MAG: AAA family ATPase [Muribaculaceae bacterium]|nr:AAA family ATPase [Muribaculaceae bacterium]